MRSRVPVFLVAIVFMLAGLSAQRIGAAPEQLEACPITLPNGSTGVPAEGPGWFGNDALATNLYTWSSGPVVVVPDDGHIDDEGVMHDLKWPWYRFVDGDLEIEGRRIDAVAPALRAWIPEGYGERGFQVSGLTFPTPGCWEITGTVGEHKLTFVTYVISNRV